MSETLNVISQDPDPKAIVFILNDNAADGRDISWIWDADFDILYKIENIKALYFSGKRKEDMALRVKYSEFVLSNFEFIDYKEDLNRVFDQNDIHKVYILPTYTALFEVRKIVDSLSKKDGIKKWR